MYEKSSTCRQSGEPKSPEAVICAWHLCVYLWHDVAAKGAGCRCGAWRLALGLVMTLSEALAHELSQSGI